MWPRKIERLDSEPGGPPIKNYYGGKSLHDQSHGESFWSLLHERLNGNGFLRLRRTGSRTFSHTPNGRTYAHSRVGE